MSKAVFQPDRIFYRTELRDNSSMQVGVAGWYFQARGGKEYGPFDDRASAEKALLEFVRDCMQRGDTGGRDPEETGNTPKFGW